MGNTDEVNEHSRDTPTLEDLRVQVAGVLVGKEWQTVAQNMRSSEELHRKGKLD
jgi:hypothetical protein